jgi:hypothetical protein
VGESRSSSIFRTALSGFCRAYLYHIKEHEVKDEFRWGLSTDFEVGDDHTSILELREPVTEDGLEEVETFVTVDAIRKRIASKESERFLLFFDMVMLQVEEHGKVNTTELTELFGVSAQTIHNWKKKLYVYFKEGL